MVFLIVIHFNVYTQHVPYLVKMKAYVYIHTKVICLRFNSFDIYSAPFKILNEENLVSKFNLNIDLAGLKQFLPLICFITISESYRTLCRAPQTNGPQFITQLLGLFTTFSVFYKLTAK